MGKPKSDENLLEKVKARFEAASRARAEQESTWVDRYKQYLSYRELDEEKKRRGQAQLFVPYSFIQAETIWPRLIRGLLGPRPWWSVKALRQDHDGKAEIMHGLMDYQFAQKMRFDLHAALWLKNALIYRFAPARVIWKLDWRLVRRWMRVADPTTGVESLREEEEPVVVYDDPWFEVLDPWHVWVAPGTGHDIQQAQWVIHRRYLSLKEFEVEAKRAGYQHATEALEKCTTKRVAGRERLSAVGLDAGDDRPDEMVVLDEMWAPDQRVVTAGESQDVLLWEGQNPYWHGRIPYLNATIFPIANELGGPSLLDVLSDLQEELNALRSLRLDDVKMGIYRMLKVLRGANVDPEDLAFRPNGFIELDNMDDVQALESPRTPTPVFAEEAIIKRDMEAAGGGYQYIRGEAPDREEKATTVVTMQREAGQRFFAMVFVLEALAFKPVAEMVAALNQQFITRERVVRLFGDEAKTLRITPDQLWGEFSFGLANTRVEPEASRQADQERWVGLYRELKGDARINQDELVRMLLQAYEVKDADKLLAPPEPAEQAPAVDAMSPAPNGQMAPENLGPAGQPELMQAMLATGGGDQM